MRLKLDPRFLSWGASVGRKTWHFTHDRCLSYVPFAA